jgi:hypothetical protein
MRPPIRAGDLVTREEWIQIRLRSKIEREEPLPLQVAALVAGIAFFSLLASI